LYIFSISDNCGVKMYTPKDFKWSSSLDQIFVEY
jgi:hypothetical protein